VPTSEPAATAEVPGEDVLEQETAGRWSRTLEARSTRAHGRRTLVKLLDAAVTEFAAYGWHGARMARIAKRAGTAHGTVYVYFSDKDDLLAAVYEDVGMEFRSVIDAMPALEPGAAGFSATREWVTRVCAALQRHGAVFQALTEALSDEEDSRAGQAALRDQSRALSAWADRIRATGTTGFDPMIAALCIYALIEGSNRSVLRGELLLSEEELVNGLAEFVHRSVFGAGAEV
jgi:AcrR family transcriptional regulator